MARDTGDGKIMRKWWEIIRENKCLMFDVFVGSRFGAKHWIITWSDYEISAGWCFPRLFLFDLIWDERRAHDQYIIFVPWVEATNRTKWSIWGFPEVGNRPDLARATGKPWTSKWRYLWNQCSRARLAVKHGGNGHMSKMFFFAMRCGLPASGWATKVLGRWERFWSWGWSEELVVETWSCHDLSW